MRGERERERSLGSARNSSPGARFLRLTARLPRLSNWTANCSLPQSFLRRRKLSRMICVHLVQLADILISQNEQASFVSLNGPEKLLTYFFCFFSLCVKNFICILTQEFKSVFPINLVDGVNSQKR